MMHLEPDYAETFLLPPAVEDWVGPDHPVRFIREYVDCLDLRKLGLKAPSSAKGRPSYSPAMLVKLWLYGYFFHVRSSRKLEAECQRSLPAMWLCGRMCPDHNTLWRFWSDNRKLIENMFNQSVRVALKVGLVAMACHALDGTKVLAAVSRRTDWHKADLNKALRQLDEAIAQIAEQIETAQAQQHDSLRLELTDAHERRKAVATALAQLKEAGRESMHPGDPDAQMMNNGGRIEWSHNAQAVVDSASGIVVAADVSSAPVDEHHLVWMLDEVREVTGDVAECILTDGAYGHSEEELAKAEQAGYDVITGRPKREKNPFDASKFTFDRQHNSCVCPQGQTLTFQSASRYGEGKEGRLLEFKCGHWRQCPMREDCCGRKRTGELRRRQVRITPYREAADRQRARVGPEERQDLMNKRLGIVEPYFARQKWLAGFTRFSFRGHDKVRTQWKMLGLINNLGVLMKQWLAGKLRLSREWINRLIPQNGTQ